MQRAPRASRHRSGGLSFLDRRRSGPLPGAVPGRGIAITSKREAEPARGTRGKLTGPRLDAFESACARAEVPAADRPALARLLERWRFAGEAQIDPEASLIADHAHWRLYVLSRNGDEDAAAGFEKYWKHHAGILLGSRYTHEQREEIVSGFFARVYRLVREPFHWNCPFTTYLRTILLNVARDLLRRIVEERESRVSIDAEGSALTRELRAPGRSPERAVLDNELTAQIRAALAALAAADRQLLEECLIGEEPGTEVARRLGIRPEALHQRLSRARRRLRAALTAIQSGQDPDRTRSTTRRAASPPRFRGGVG